MLSSLQIKWVLQKFINFILILFKLLMSHSKPQIILYEIHQLLFAQNQLFGVRSDRKVQSKQTKSVFQFILKRQQKQGYIQFRQYQRDIVILIVPEVGAPYLVLLVSRKELQRIYFPNSKLFSKDQQSEIKFGKDIADFLNLAIIFGIQKCTGRKSQANLNLRQMTSPMPLMMWTEPQRTQINHELTVLGYTALIKRMFKIIFICQLSKKDNVIAYLNYDVDKKTKTKSQLKMKNPEPYLEVISWQLQAMKTQFIEFLEDREGQIFDTSLDQDKLQLGNQKLKFKFIAQIKTKIKDRAYTFFWYFEHQKKYFQTNQMLSNFILQKKQNYKEFIEKLQQKMKPFYNFKKNKKQPQDEKTNQSIISVQQRDISETIHQQGEQIDLILQKQIPEEIEQMDVQLSQDLFFFRQASVQESAENVFIFKNSYNPIFQNLRD